MLKELEIWKLKRRSLDLKFNKDCMLNEKKKRDSSDKQLKCQSLNKTRNMIMNANKKDHKQQRNLKITKTRKRKRSLTTKISHL